MCYFLVELFGGIAFHHSVCDFSPNKFMLMGIILCFFHNKSLLIFVKEVLLLFFYIFLFFISFQQISDELEDGKETPEEIAANFTCTLFETPQDVLKGARHMVLMSMCVFSCVFMQCSGNNPSLKLY